MRHLSLAAVLVFALSLPAAAQDTREARLTAARGYVALTMESFDMAALIRTMYQPILDQLASQGTRLNARQLAELDQLYQSTMTEPLRQIMTQQDQIMADLFTLEEIEAISAFYASPVGRSVMAKLPQLTQALQPMIISFMQGAMPDLIPQIQAIIGR